MNDMFSSINLLAQGTYASWMRSDVINNNIANVDTSNFKRSTVNFEEYFDSALSGKGISLKKTRDKHRNIGGSGDLTTYVSTDTSTTMRNDGNNVDIDQEMTEMAKNIIYYNTLTTQISKEFNTLQAAITGR